MSLLSDWIASAMHPHGETALNELAETFKAAMCTSKRERQEYPIGLIIKELTELGYRIESRGRKDQPIRTVIGASFEPMPVDKRLQRQIVDFVFGHSVGRYISTNIEGDGWDETTAQQRPDYDPALYRLTWADIAARLTVEGIPCTERDVRVAFQTKAALERQELQDPFWNHGERETTLDKYVRCVAPDGLVDRRWLIAGETLAGRDHYGVPHPVDGPATKRWMH